MLRGLRLVKLPEEIDRIEMACRQVDTGIIGAINHMEGAHSGSAYRKGFYTVPEFIERVRIHAYEGGTSMSGQHGGGGWGSHRRQLYAAARFPSLGRALPDRLMPAATAGTGASPRA